LALFSGKKILVTGGNGAIGCNLVEKLLKLDAKVTVLDNFSQSSKGNLKHDKNLQLIQGDITNSRILKKIFSQNFYHV